MLAIDNKLLTLPNLVPKSTFFTCRISQGINSIAQSILTLDPSSYSKTSKLAQCAIVALGFGALVTLSAIGILPAFVWMGTAVASITLGAALVCVVVEKILGIGKEDPDNKYIKALLEMTPFLPTIIIPALEELAFRAGLQKLFLLAFTAILPTASIALLGVSFTPASLVAIGIASILFGLMHAFNEHKNNWSQAFNTFVIGVFLGVTAATLGIYASILAHCMHNLILIAVLHMVK